MIAPHFEITARDPATGARCGLLRTAHGDVETPAFFPVGTQATVKAMPPEDLLAIGVPGILANAYHLHLRPGEDLIRQAGGLHRFMNWPRAILTDSGGYQVFSLEALREVDDEGVTFVSPHDGTQHRLTAEGAVAIQEALGADIIVTLDQPIEYPSDLRTAELATRRSETWAVRGKRAHTRQDQLLFGIVQGGFDAKLRAETANRVAQEAFDGYCIGGLSVGEPRDLTFELLAASASALPQGAPRHLMGVGTPEDILDAVALGADLFDCVLPTRLGRNGCAFTSAGRLSLKNACYVDDFRPLDERCDCRVCRGYTRAYIRHLYQGREILAAILVTHHNLWFYTRLLEQARAAIAAGTLAAFRASLAPSRPTSP
jgi:queuine tRNA-ribosyltransferase